MSGLDLSVITVCMNRQAHLLQTAQRVAAWPYHCEHMILDWSSHQPVDRSQLPDDPRIRLERVDGETRWNLCRAYNFAVHLSRGAKLLKLDADCWPDQLDPSICCDEISSVCWFGSGPEGRLGQFLIARKTFEAVGGFNETLLGYGFDDKDLKARLLSCDFSIRELPLKAIGVIEHSIHDRVSRDEFRQASSSAYEHSLSFALRRSTAMSNRVSAAYFPWTIHRALSTYRNNSPNGWVADQGSLPVLAPAVSAELERLRRQTFWSRFLELPELHVKLLPVKLLPPDRDGRFPIRWWHRLYWHSLRRIFRCPVDLLACFKGWGKRFR